MVSPMLPAHTSSISSGRRKVVAACRLPLRSASNMNRVINEIGDWRGMWLGHRAFGHSRL